MVGSATWKQFASLMEQVPCNLCGHSEYTTVHQGPDLLLNNREILFTLVKCTNCGLIYQNPRPTQEEMQEAYPVTYESFTLDNSRSWLAMQVYRYGIEKRCKSVISTKGERGILLDIGCSTGTFLNTMKTKFGWEAYGVEVNHYAAEIAHDRFKLEIFNGNLEQASYPSNFFDAITLWDVLEHLPDPSSTLQEIKRIIKPDGIVIFRTPNYDSWGAKIFGTAWAGFDAPRHLFVFSQKNLLMLLNKIGFSAPKLSSFSGGFPMFVISVQFYMNQHKIKLAYQKILCRLINNAITQIILTPIIYLCSLFLHGEEITAITSPIADKKI